MSNVRVWVAIAAVSMAAPLLAQTGEPPAEVVIRDISVVDVEAGRLLPARDIVVRGTRVERVAPAGGALPRGKTLIEGRGKFAIPGLIDAPVRLAGVLTVDAAGPAGGRDHRGGRRRHRPGPAGRLASRSQRGPPLRTTNRPGLWSRRDRGRGGVAHVARCVRERFTTNSSGSRRRPTARPRRRSALSRSIARGRSCLDGLGAIAAGAPADLVVLAANPLDDIRHTRAIDAVVFRGEVFTQAHVTQLRRGALPAPTPPR